MWSTLLDQVDESVHGVIWLTDTPLSDRPGAFHELNYLTDGQLVSAISSEQVYKEGTPTLFFSTSFNQPFFVAHVKTSGSAIDNQIAGILSIKKESGDKKIMLLNQSKISAQKLIDKYHLTAIL